MNIETELRATLEDEAAFANDLENPYRTFIQRETTRRRARRLRVAGAMAAALAVVLAAIGIERLDLLTPKPNPWAPAAEIPVRALLDSPLRGSLAQDQTFLTAMLGRLPEGARLLYASDVGDQRLVLASVPGEPTTLLMWFAGPVGAKAKQAQENYSGEAAAASHYTSTTSHENGVAVVVGPVGYTASIKNESDGHYSVEGTIGPGGGTATGEEGSGLLEAQVDPQIANPVFSASMAKDEQTFPVKSGGGVWQQTDNSRAPYIAKAKTALEGRNFDDQLLGLWLKDAMQTAHQHLAPSTVVRVRWTGKIDDRPAAVLTVQPSGQGVLAFAYLQARGPEDRQLHLLLPTEGADTRPIAYRISRLKKATNQVVVVAPAGAARVTVSVQGAEPVEVELDGSGLGRLEVDPKKAATATAYAVDGSEMGSTSVRGFEPFTNLVGDTPETRVVP